MFFKSKTRVDAFIGNMRSFGNLRYIFIFCFMKLAEEVMREKVNFNTGHCASVPVEYCPEIQIK